MSLLPLLLTVAYAVSYSVLAYSCSNDEDCELLGKCVEGSCQCRMGWRGPSCGTLRVGPAILPNQGIWPLPDSHRTQTTYSWGFTVVKVGDVYHGWANQGCYNTSIGMVSGTFILHTTSAVDPNSPNTGGFTGEFKADSIMIPASSFNPHIIYSEIHGQYVMLFRINDLDGGWNVCIGNESDSQFGTSSIAADQLSEHSMNVAVSDSPYGPWTVHPLSIANINPKTHISNPSALQLDNGSWVMAYRWNGGNEHVGIATSRESTLPIGPWYNVANLSVPGEDPFIWNEGGSLHIIFHVENGQAYSEQPSLHAWAAADDLYHWNVSRSFEWFGEGAYSTNITWTDSTTQRFYRRERPEILFDDNGRPLWFLSAVQEQRTPNQTGFPFSYSVAQPMF